MKSESARRSRAKRHVPDIACPNCEFALTNIPSSGVCPECGQPYQRALLVKAGPKPWLGVGQLLIPPMTAASAWALAAFVVPPIGIVVALLSKFIGLLWGDRISRRMARWQATFEMLRDDPVPHPHEIERRTRRLYRIYSTLENVAMLGVLAIFATGLGVLRQMGLNVRWP